MGGCNVGFTMMDRNSAPVQIHEMSISMHYLEIPDFEHETWRDSEQMGCTAQVPEIAQLKHETSRQDTFRHAEQLCSIEDPTLDRNVLRYDLLYVLHMLTPGVILSLEARRSPAIINENHQQRPQEELKLRAWRHTPIPKVIDYKLMQALLQSINPRIITHSSLEHSYSHTMSPCLSQILVDASSEGSLLELVVSLLPYTFIVIVIYGTFIKVACCIPSGTETNKSYCSTSNSVFKQHEKEDNWNEVRLDIQEQMRGNQRTSRKAFATKEMLAGHEHGDLLCRSLLGMRRRLCGTKIVNSIRLIKMGRQAWIWIWIGLS
ncbi:predicted protein [Lichtheimia corymbifera JMRC:FSU:9682]|uniref:Uncharacterized protein n=1 Tax=Lichtheimia corymbifera JMRC:FSU:9682 TaxID=1263082 RepID=A0A068RHG9_9FUNG|nr:predicted protein [Lichtheimia corymbifera JMRC:FSU:9682]